MSSLLQTQHWVIVGAGYAGLPLALSLSHQLKHDLHRGRLKITVLHPKAKQDLTCDLHRVLRHGEAEQIFLGKYFKHTGVDFIEAKVGEINPQKHQLKYHGERSGTLDYDKLILASGLQPALPDSIEGFRELWKTDEAHQKRVFLFRNNDQALALRMALKRIDWDSSQGTKRKKDFFAVIVGAGTTGLEVAGELAALRKKDPRARVVLIDKHTELLKSFSPIAKKLLKRELKKLNIETVLGSSAFRISEAEIYLQNGQVIPWDMLILCTGSVPGKRLYAPFASAMGERGLKVNAKTFGLEGFPQHYAVGDLAQIPQRVHPLANATYVEKRAQFATQEAYFLADHLAHEFRETAKEKKAKSFSPNDLGYLVALGPRGGIGRIGPELHGGLKKMLSPFVYGPLVDQLKKSTQIKYLAQLEWKKRIS